MAQQATKKDLDFLEALDQWVAEGGFASHFAAKREITPGTVTYQANRFNLKAKRNIGLVDKRTGERLPVLLRRRRIVLTDNQAAA